jgi:ATP-binding protein involved in chromosome partitioning
MTESLSPEAVVEAIREFKDPESGRSVVQMKQVDDVTVSAGDVSLTLALTTHSAAIWDDVYDEAEQHLKARLPAADSIRIKRAIHERPAEKLGSIGLTAKSVIAVGSGKGGVGKSTVATSLAVALKRAGSKVGLLDADVFGPSIPTLTGTQAAPLDTPSQSLKLVDYDGIPLMSIGYLVPADQAVIWRGPMLHSIVSQFLRDVEWGELDYLIIDMPPGTGDIPLTLSQLLPQSHAVVVCTPQEVALIDAIKAITMFRTMKTSVLGMVENMSGFICPDCGKRYDIFGIGGAKAKAEELEIAFLGDIPLNMQIRVNGDNGHVADSFDDPLVAPHLTRLAHQMVRRLADSARTAPPGPALPILG